MRYYRNYNLVRIYLYKPSIHNFVKSQGELGSRLTGYPESSKPGDWKFDHFFKIIYLDKFGKRPIILKAGNFEKISRYFNYIRINATSIKNLGDQLFIHVK